MSGALTLTEGVDVSSPPIASSTLLKRSLRLWRTKIGAVLVLILIFVAFLGPYLAPHGPTDFMNLPNTPPGQDSGVLGTDYLGQDVLTRFLYGGRELLVLAAAAVAIGLVAGIAIGLFAAYSRSWPDSVLMRGMDVIMSFPQILLALVAVSLIGPQPWVVIAAIALATAPQVARVTRGAAQPIIERDFVEAAEATGLSRTSILAGEVFPNIMGPIMVEASLRLTYSINTIAALAFLGLSTDPNAPNWGTMIQQNRIALTIQPWGVLLPVVAIALLTLGTGLIGDGIARTAAGIDRERGEE